MTDTTIIVLSTLLGASLTLLLIVFWPCIKHTCLLFYSYFAKPINLQKFGSVAIVTGGSDGIGKAYVQVFLDDEMEWKWIGSEPEMDRKWIGNGSEVERK